MKNLFQRLIGYNRQWGKIRDLEVLREEAQEECREQEALRLKAEEELRELKTSLAQPNAIIGMVEVVDEGTRLSISIPCYQGGAPYDAIGRAVLANSDQLQSGHTREVRIHYRLYR